MSVLDTVSSLQHVGAHFAPDAAEAERKEEAKMPFEEREPVLYLVTV